MPAPLTGGGFVVSWRTSRPHGHTTMLDAFTTAYLACAFWLWEVTDSPAPSVEDIDPETLDLIREDCDRFQVVASHHIDGHERQAGHDFWLTRNGHGTGFWDRPEVYGDESADILTTLAATFGESYLYRGDDGKVYSN